MKYHYITEYKGKHKFQNTKRFKKNFCFTVGYIPEKEKSSNSSVTLVPAWCFDYVDSRTENGEEIIIYFTVAYSVETGRWMGRFY